MASPHHVACATATTGQCLCGRVAKVVEGTENETEAESESVRVKLRGALTCVGYCCEYYVEGIVSNCDLPVGQLMLASGGRA